MKGSITSKKRIRSSTKTAKLRSVRATAVYMANWILVTPIVSKCIVSHDGMFNTESAYGTTEELWFNEWEIQRSAVEEPRPLSKILAALVRRQIQNADPSGAWPARLSLDASEGFQLFTTLQRLKVPSKMLYFPDEGHWVLKPQNSRLWYKR